MSTTTVGASAPKTAAHVVGFSKANASTLASDTLAILRLVIDGNQLSGDKRARAITNARTLATMVLADAERDADLAKTARGTRIGVQVETKLRGESTIATQSLPILDVLRAIVFGGNVAGSGKLVTK